MWIDTSTDSPILELEVKYPPGVLQRKENHGYMLRLALEWDTSEADRSNAFKHPVVETRCPYRNELMSPTMFNFSKALDLSPQLQWKYSDEAELLGWTIRARNYNTFVANCMFSFLAVFILGASFIMYNVYEGMNQPWRTLSCVFFYVLLLFVTSCMTHQRMNFAYRFTQSGVECCEWKDSPKWALTFLKWFSGITAIIFIFLATIDPAFLIGALVGPGGMGLIYLSMANSKSYQKMQTQYHHLVYEWEVFTQLAIATNREVVDLKYTMYDNGLVNWSQNIFCKRKQKEIIAEFIKPYLSPEVPFIKAKVNVPMSTD